MSGAVNPSPRFWPEGLRDTTVAEFSSISAPISEYSTFTRGGDVLRTWRLSGVVFQGVDAAVLDAQHEALCTLLRNLPEGRCAVYMHRIQRRATDRLRDPSSPMFSAQFSKDYQDHLQGRPFLLKEFFLTVLYRPFESERDRKLLRAGQSQQAMQLWFDELEATMNELASAVDSALSDFDPRPLGVRVEDDGQAFWEAGELYGYLVNGVWTKTRVPSGPAWKSLPDARLTFGGAELEINRLGVRRFASLLDIKEYPAQVDPGSLSALLYVDSEYIETQCIRLIPRRQAMAALTLQRNQLLASGDVVVTQIEAMDDALDRLGDGQFSMGEYSYTLAVFGNTPAEARRAAQEAKAAVAKVSSISMVPVDLLADAAWFAQQPGNFQWHTRKALVSTRVFAALASCHTFHLGKRDGNPWGEALAIMRTPAGHGFYLNLHATASAADEEGKKLPGNTILIGQTGSGKTTLLTALMALSAKWPRPPRIVSFSLDRDTEILIRALGGVYHQFEYGQPTGLSPLQRPVTDARVAHWISLVRRCLENAAAQLLPDEQRAVEHAVRSVASLPSVERTFTTLLGFLPRSDSANSLYDRFERWTRGHELGWVFDGGPDSLGDVSSHRYLGFDYTSIVDADEIRVPVMMDLLSIVEELVDGTPFIYHVAEAWKALGDPVFASFVKHGQKTIRKKNGLGIFDTQEIGDLLDNANGRTMIEQSVTKICLPNLDASASEYERAGFTPAEFELIRSLGRSGSREFLIKQSGSATVCQFDLSGMDDALVVLSTSLDNLHLLDQIRALHGDRPEDWMKPFFARVRQAHPNFRKAA
jgi:type IV secretion system protein VirB4